MYGRIWTWNQINYDNLSHIDWLCIMVIPQALNDLKFDI